MFTAYLLITALAAAANAYGATGDFIRSRWILDNMTRYGVPHSWLVPLGAMKAAGALGLVIGIGVPFIGIAASTGLVLYFIGALITVSRAKVYSHLPFPAIFLVLAATSLMLRLASSAS